MSPGSLNSSTLIIVAETHPGKVRDHNEDAYLCSTEQRMALIADGMGGHAAGEVASDITVKTFDELKPESNELVAAAVESHQRIIAHAEAHPDSRGMGSALVAAKFSQSEVNICWIGDSRAYLYSEHGGLQPITRDHSYVQWLLANGQINEHQARIHPDRNLVTQCLGIHPPQPEVNITPWQSGDIILLCSDGLTDEIDDQAIEKILQQSSTLETGLQQLLEAALARGGKDNITVVLAQNNIKSAALMTPRIKLGKLQSAAWMPIAVGAGDAILLALVWLLVSSIF